MKITCKKDKSGVAEAYVEAWRDGKQILMYARTVVNGEMFARNYFYDEISFSSSFAALAEALDASAAPTIKLSHDLIRQIFVFEKGDGLLIEDDEDDAYPDEDGRLSFPPTHTP